MIHRLWKKGYWLGLGTWIEDIGGLRRCLEGWSRLNGLHPCTSPERSLRI